MKSCLVDIGVNPAQHPGKVWGWKQWRAGHTGDILGSMGKQLSEMGHLESCAFCYE